MLLWERCVLDGRLLELRLDRDLGYRLSFGDEVVYETGFRRIKDRRTPYRFRSVEQLRYDFEQDVRSIGGELG